MAERVKNNFDNQVDGYLSFLKNEYVAAAVSLFLIVYAGVIAPKLSPSVLSLFDNWVVQIALFFAIVYVSKQNATVALIAAVAVLVTLMIVNSKITVKLQPPTSEHFCSTKTSPWVPGYDLLPNCKEPYNPYTSCGNDVDGIMDESAEEVDHHMAGFRNAVVRGGAITSKGAPMINSMNETAPETVSQTMPETASETAQEPVVGIEQSHMDNELVGATLDETHSMGSENASADNESEMISDEISKVSAEDAIKSTVEQVTSEVEQTTGATIPAETQEDIMSEVKKKLAELADQGKVVHGHDVVRLCRDLYSKQF